MQITACCDIGAFEQEVNQLRTHQGQSDVFVINKRGALLWSEHQSGTLTLRDLENAALPCSSTAA